MTENDAPTVGAGVVRLGPDDRDRALSSLTVAFAADPVIRWVLSASDEYLRTWPMFVDAFAGGAFGHSTAYSLADFSAVALWLPPGVEPDGATMVALMSEGSDDAIADDLNGVFEQMEEFHPSFEHWYLPLIGVDPVAQGRGLGSALMRHVLDELDDRQVPGYLEATSPRSKVMYERYRFETIGVIQHGSSPPMYPMVRAPSSERGPRRVG